MTMNYPLPPPNQGYHTGGGMPPPPGPEGMHMAMMNPGYVAGGSVPGPNKTPEQANHENLLKYRKLKTKYFELESRWKDSLHQLERARQQNVRLKEEKAGFLDRVVELESVIAHQNGGNPPIPSTAFPRNYVYPRVLSAGSVPVDYLSMSKVLDDDDDEDMRSKSKHVGAALKRREEEDEQRRLDEERQRRTNKRPRTSKNLAGPPPDNGPPGGIPYPAPGYGQPHSSHSPNEMYPPPQQQPMQGGTGGIYPVHPS